MILRSLPLALGFFWIVSVAAAYFFGTRVGEGRGGSGDHSLHPSITFAPGGGDGRSATAGESVGEGDAAPEGDSVDAEKVRRILESASRGMGSGSAAMFSPSKMFRACGPLMELSVEEVRAALLEAKTTVSDPQQRMLLESILLGRWAEEDPLAALGYAEELVKNGGAMQGQALFSVIGVWAQKDPEAALTWYRKRRDSSDPGGSAAGEEGTLMVIFNGLVARDPERALDQLGLLDDEPSRRVAIGGIAMAATQSEMRMRLLARAETMDIETRDGLRQGIVGSWAVTDPEGAMEWIGGLPPEEREAMLDMAGQSLLFANPEKGAEYLMETATDETLSRRYSQIVSAWALRDPIGAGEWLNRQPKNPAQDSARSTFSLNVMRSDPEVAMEWAKSIAAEAQRSGTIQAVYTQWRKRNPDAAEAALSASGLSDERIGMIRKGTEK